MSLVGAVVHRFARLCVKFLSCPASDVAVELDVRRVKLGLASRQYAIETLDQPRHFVAIEMPVVIVQLIEMRRLLIFRLVIPALNSPNIGPMSGRRMVRAEQVVGTRNPFIEIFL